MCGKARHQAAGSVYTENRTSAAWRVVRWSFIFVVAAYRALLLLSLLVSGAGTPKLLSSFLPHP